MNIDPDADAGGAPSTTAPIDPIEFFDSNDRVLALMNMRRTGAGIGADTGERNRQRADEIKATLCTKIHDLVRSVPGLRERIVAISDIDPELSAYIMALESINRGIWCPNCKVVKRFGGNSECGSASGLPGGVESARSPGVLQSVGNVGNVGSVGNVKSVRSEQDSLEISKLRAHLHTAREELSLLSRENSAMKDRMELITIKLDSYNTRLNAFNVPFGAAPHAYRQSQHQSVHPQSVHRQSQQQSVHRQSQSVHPQVQQSPLNDLKKEDLPPAPEFDLVFTMGEISSADSILE